VTLPRVLGVSLFFVLGYEGKLASSSLLPQFVGSD
jgi:hypothetical protein